MLALLCAIWGLTFPATRSALNIIDPMQFLTARFGIALLVLTPIVLLKHRSHSSKNKSTSEKKYFTTGSHPSLLVRSIQRIDSVWLRGALVGVFLFLGFALQVYGLRFTTASRSGFFTGLLVVITPILASILRTSRTPTASWIGIIPAFSGVLLLSNPGAGGMNLGDWLTIGCALAFAIQMVVLESSVRPNDSILDFSMAQITIVFLCGLVWCVIEGVNIKLTPTVWLALLYTGIFGSLAAVWLQTRFQPMVPAGHAALVFTLEPVFTAGFAYLLLNETWTKIGLAGAGLVLVGMVISSLGIEKGAPDETT